MTVQTVQANGSKFPTQAKIYDTGFEPVNALIVQDKVLGKEVERIGQIYQTVNVQDAMEKLSQVGSLLQLAYAGTKGLSCNVSITEMLCNYQSVIKDSYATSTLFVEASLSACKNHQLALAVLTKPAGAAGALKLMAKTSALAEKMAIASEALVVSSSKMVELSKKSLMDASSDDKMLKDKFDALMQEIATFEAEQAGLRSETEDLQRDIEDAKSQELKAAKEADSARRQAMTMKLVGVLAGAVTGGLGLLAGTMGAGSQNDEKPKPTTTAKVPDTTELKDKKKEVEVEIEKKQLELLDAKDEKTKKDVQARLDLLKSKKEEINQEIKKVVDGFNAVMEANAASLEAKEAMIASRRAALQTEQRAANAKLASTIKKLETSSTDKKDLTQVIASLEVAVKTLGKIKTIFENTRLYWMGVKQQCLKLNDISTMQDIAEIDDSMFADEICWNGMCWLSLAQINYVGSKAMGDINKKVDGIMNDLPSGAESKQIIARVSQDLLASIAAENERLSIA
ncbi:hypothetical protein BC833DRAFT_623647 [Globomyces pollinis-pini]|nr:hypothetical protein BC833DRAFT_623647 [Globomyces pollinis-pini]